MELPIKFVGIQAGEKPPRVALFLLAPGGRVVRKLTADRDAKFEVDPSLAREAIAAIGPDVDDPSELEPNALLQFRPPERLPEWERVKAIAIPRDWWVRWLSAVVCVNGRVRRCRRPLFLKRLAGLFPVPDLHFPPRLCLPICNGVVEVYERTCCCRPPVPVDVPPILARLRELVRPMLHWPPPPPIEDTRQEPRIPLDRIAARKVKEAEAFGQADLTAPPNQQLRVALETVEKLGPDEAAEYLEAHPFLWPLWCRCSSRKVGEAVLGPDGRFHFCYRKFALPNPFCRTFYYYKVRQWQDTGWVTIYDGDRAHQHFTAGEFADMLTYLGRACQGQQPVPAGPKPNVMLQDIGGIHSFNLVSHYMGKSAAGVDLTQIGQYSLATPTAEAGLVNPPDHAPLAKTLKLRLYCHPDLKTLGAVHYRVSIVAAAADGTPAGGATPAPLTSPVSWRKFVSLGGHYTVDSEPLGPFSKTVGGDLISGLYRIPYDSDAFWLGGQYHQDLDTTLYPNGRYLLVVEVFDAAGNRLRPDAAADAGTPAGFEFQRWLVDTGSDSTAEVPFGALTHMVWFDNRPCYADIEDLRKNHAANTQECQFLGGPASTGLSVGFRAFHSATGDAIPAPQTFMDYFELWWHRGLNGPTVLLQTGDTNQPATLLGGPSAESTTVTFGTLLGTSTVGAKCTFAINLNVYAKHTDGIRRISEYDRYDEAAFAIEITS